MEDEKVSFETAKLAKEKGFNEICNSHFEEDSGSYDSYGEEFKPNDVQTHEILYAKPTQSLLQKWLREVHNIHINIDCWKSATFHLIYDKDKKGSFYPKNPSTWRTYEEALEVGLQEALKLIKV